MRQKKQLRYNKGKTEWSLLDFKSLEPMARVMMKGAEKYSAHNWRSGLESTKLLDCLLRHITSYANGETFDKETGEHHIAHAMCNCMMIIHNEREFPYLDDRFIIQPKPKNKQK